MVDLAQVVGADLAKWPVLGLRVMVMFVAGKEKGFEVLPCLELLMRYNRLTIQATRSVGAPIARKARPRPIEVTFRKVLDIVKVV